jgi:uncharacterized protein YabN with tetrapyrrole methylase and pyrophosphatase domain
MPKPLRRGEIAVVGLGPTADLRFMPQEGMEFLKAIGNSTDKYLRIFANDAELLLQKHPVFARARKANLHRGLFPLYTSQDASPGHMYRYMARLLFRRARQGYKVVFLSMGNPFLWAQVPSLLKEWCKEEKVPFRIYSALSFLDLAYEHMDTSVGESMIIGQASGVISGITKLSKTASCLIGQLMDNRGTSSKSGFGTHPYKSLQKALELIYPSDHKIVFIWAEGSNFEMKSEAIKLNQLGEYPVTRSWTNIWIPPVSHKA